MEVLHSGVGDVGHTVQSIAADVEYQRDVQALGHLHVYVLEEAPVVFAAHEVARGVVWEGERVGAGVYLGFAEQDGEFLELVEAAHRLFGVVNGH